MLTVLVVWVTWLFSTLRRFSALVIAVDINDDKLALARETGADYVINGRKVEDVPARIRELTGGRPLLW